MARVITAFGIGTIVEEFSSGFEAVRVTLDKPFLGESQIRMGKNEVFLFSDWAIVKVINIAGHGCFSNLQFCDSQVSAEAMLDFSTPPDETIFFLDFQSGRFRVNHQLGLLARHSIIIKPWVDRWAPERTESFNLIAQACEEFLVEKESLAGTTAGIGAFVHLGSEGGGNILGFYIAIPSPQGVIFEKEFELKLRKG